MFDLIHAGFDTLDIAFAGALPENALKILEQARDKAQETQEATLVTIGPGEVAMHVSGHGMRGGYAFVVDTGPLGAQWRFKKNSDVRQWNIFVSPYATALLAYGYGGIRDKLHTDLNAMGARITEHSLNRVDFAMDFRTQGFELQLDQFVAHAHSKVTPYWGAPESSLDRNQLSAVVRGRRLESVTVGKQPGRQIIVYDKRREAIAKQKYFWFDAWGLDRRDPNVEVWRIEVRAGKNELKDKYQIRQFADFEAGIGDVITNSLLEVRYLDDQQHDNNVTRQRLHSLWAAAQKAAQGKLTEFRSGLTPDQIVEIERELAMERYTKQIIGNAIGLGVSLGLSNEDIIEELPTRLADYIEPALSADDGRSEKSIRRARERLHFISTSDL